MGWHIGLTSDDRDNGLMAERDGMMVPRDRLVTTWPRDASADEVAQALEKLARMIRAFGDGVTMTDDYVKSACKLGCGKYCCRYLAMDADGWDCLKLTPMRKMLDERVRLGTIRATGDNCVGVKRTSVVP